MIIKGIQSLKDLIGGMMSDSNQLTVNLILKYPYNQTMFTMLIIKDSRMLCP